MSKKKNKQKANKQQQISLPVIPMLNYVTPKTITQNKAFEAYAKGKNLLLHGVAGTGKSFIALYLALESVLTGQAPKPIVIMRSVVPVREVGYLPGNIKEKTAVYEAPYVEIISELVDKPYEWMKQNGYVDFVSTSFLRGTTYRNCIIIVDECQNMTDMEIHTIMTRVGEGSRIILCGDFRQKDYMKERSGINNLLKIINNMKSFETFEFRKEDVVRSGFVREYLFSRMYLDDQGLLT